MLMTAGIVYGMIVGWISVEELFVIPLKKSPPLLFNMGAAFVGGFVASRYCS